MRCMAKACIGITLPNQRHEGSLVLSMEKIPDNADKGIVVVTPGVGLHVQPRQLPNDLKFFCLLNPVLRKDDSGGAVACDV